MTHTAKIKAIVEMIEKFRFENTTHFYFPIDKRPEILGGVFIKSISAYNYSENGALSVTLLYNQHTDETLGDCFDDGVFYHGYGRMMFSDGDAGFVWDSSWIDSIYDCMMVLEDIDDWAAHIVQMVAYNRQYSRDFFCPNNPQPKWEDRLIYYKNAAMLSELEKPYYPSMEFETYESMLKLGEARWAVRNKPFLTRVKVLLKSILPRTSSATIA
jgi:hypothetical protein